MASAAVAVFDGLPTYTKDEVELNNCFAKLFGGGADGHRWIQEGLASLLEAPGKALIRLQQVNQVDATDSRELSFQSSEVRIGRKPDNDVVIPIAGIGRHHVRILNNGGKFFLEDLGSANGTYLNDKKLKPHEAVAISNGASFLVFPYQFTFSSEEVWHPEMNVRIASGEARVRRWQESSIGRQNGLSLFSLRVLPDIGSAVLAISQNLLETAVQRMTRDEVSHLVVSDTGLIEFLMLSVLERASRDLRFPFRFSLAPFEEPTLGESGISKEYVVGLTGCVGTVEVFLPASLLQRARKSQANVQPASVPAVWPLLLTGGYADLSAAELSGLELGDILLYGDSRQLLLPRTAGRAESGWRILRDGERMSVEEYFERNPLMENQESGAGMKPDLSSLPVRVHVVLSQLDMTLAELDRLTPGAIVEIQREKNAPVQLAVNGKIAGAGELVEVEGRLGVRITNWFTQ